MYVQTVTSLLKLQHLYFSSILFLTLPILMTDEFDDICPRLGPAILSSMLAKNKFSVHEINFSLAKFYFSLAKFLFSPAKKSGPKDGMGI